MMQSVSFKAKIILIMPLDVNLKVYVHITAIIYVKEMVKALHKYHLVIEPSHSHIFLTFSMIFTFLSVAMIRGFLRVYSVSAAMPDFLCYVAEKKCL